MSLRDTVSGAAGAGNETDKTYEKIIQKKNILDIPHGQQESPRFYFRITKGAETDFYHYMQFWLVGGYDQVKKKMKTLPRVSSNPITDFIYKNKGGQNVLGRSALDKGCALSKLAFDKHPLIGLNEMRPDGKGGFKANVDPVHAFFVQEVIPTKDAQGNVIMDGARPKFTIVPEEKIFQAWQSLWDQFVNIVDPQEAAPAAQDGFSAAPTVAVAPKLPTTDLTKLVFMVWKSVRTEKKTGNPAMDIDYHIAFSDRVGVLKDSEIPAIVDEIGDMGRAYQPIKPEELDAMKLRAEAIASGNYRPGAPSGAASASGPSPDSPANYGTQLPPPVAVAPAAVAAAPVAQAVKPGF